MHFCLVACRPPDVGPYAYDAAKVNHPHDAVRRGRRAEENCQGQQGGPWSSREALHGYLLELK